MHIECDKEILSENIGTVQRAVSTRTSLPILECILLSCNDASFRMSATDQEIGIKTEKIQCEILEEGSVALPSRFFSDIVRRLPEGKVSIKTGEGYISVITCKNTEFKIVGRNPEEFPELPEVERDKRYIIKQGTLKNQIRQTVFSICQDETKPNLNGSLIEIDGKDVTMVTCDTFRVSLSRGEIEIAAEAEQVNESVIIPSKTISEMSKLLARDNEDVSLYLTNKHILFDVGFCTVVSRLIEGEFINYVNIFPSEFESNVIVNRVALLDALERAALVSYYENKKNPVRMKMEDNMMYITTAAETGNASDTIEMVLSGKNLEIAFNPRYLIDAIKSIDEDELSLGFNTPLSPCIIKAASGEDSCKYLVLPLRLKS